MTTLRDRRTALVLILVCLTMSCGSSIAAPASAQGVRSKLVYPGPDGKLHYLADENGNTIPDFSNWKDHDAFEKAFARLQADLKADGKPKGIA